MILLRFVDHGHIVVYRVAHLVGRRGFDEALQSAAHRGTVINKKESGPGHRREKVLRLVAKTIRKFAFFRIGSDSAVRKQLFVES